MECYDTKRIVSMFGRPKIPTTDNTRIVALTERETPFCDCGEPTAAIAEDRQLWLNCTARQHRSGGALRQFIGALASTGHTRQLLVDPI
jgi:hypothetical protein